MIQPKIPAIGPRIPPVFVKTTAPAKLFKTLPPYGAPAVLVFLRNWIITAFCKGMTAKDPLAGQPCTLKHTILFQCFNGVLRTRRCVNTVSVSFKRRKIFLVSSYHQDHRSFYDSSFSTFTSILLKYDAVRTGAYKHLPNVCNLMLLRQSLPQR